MVDSRQLGNDAVMLERWLAQARGAIERAQWPLAEDRLRRLHGAAPADLDVVRLLAQVMRERGASSEAEALLTRVFKDAPEEAWPGKRELLLELADLRLAVGRAGDAARALRRVLDVEPHHWEALALMGNVFLDSGHPVEAANAYRESVSANPFESETWWNLATALEQAGEPGAAADALEGWLGAASPSPSERAETEADIARLRAAHPRAPGS